jgi:hypothetical protein
MALEGCTECTARGGLPQFEEGLLCGKMTGSWNGEAVTWREWMY